MKSQNSVTFKLVIVGILAFVCLVPTFFMWALLSERTDRKNEAKKEITEKWGASQVIAGPILSLPYSKTTVDAQGFRRESSGVLNVLPQKLVHDGDMEPEIRSRGIFEAVVYKTKIRGQGTFQLPDFAYLNVKPAGIQWNKAYIAMGITDTRGIAEQASLQWNGSAISFEPGIKNPAAGTNGMHAFVPIDPSRKSFNFSYAFGLNGSEKLEFLPLGNDTEVSIKSAWSSPSFTGAYLPDKREIAENFSANWTVSSFGRSYPNQWIDSEVTAETLSASRFGVSLIQNVDFYTQTDRAIKYAIMFIAITFLTFFLFEVLAKLKIHPFQYLLVGFALALFYLLLLSISERLGFLAAYGISTFATVCLITVYSAKVLRANKKALIMAALLFLLYTYLYIIVQLEDMALMSGSVLLFVLLALAMYMTRNIDWYRIDSGEKIRS